MQRDTVFTITVYPETYRDIACTSTVFFCPAVATCVSLCLLSVLVIRTTQSDPSIHDVLPLEIHGRQVSNAERVDRKERVNWKASRATSGAACFCEVRILVVVDEVGTWQSAFR